MESWIVVALGGAMGTLARHGVNVAVTRLLGESVPYATATVNVVGSAAIGMLAGAVASGGVHLTEHARLFVFVGVLGGFTTFSSLGLDTFTLIRGDQLLTAMVNLAGQVAVGFGALAAGYAFVSSAFRAAS